MCNAMLFLPQKYRHSCGKNQCKATAVNRVKILYWTMLGKLLESEAILTRNAYRSVFRPGFARVRTRSLQRSPDPIKR